MKMQLVALFLVACVNAVPQAAPTQKPRTNVSQAILDSLIHYAGYAATAPFPCKTAPQGAVIQGYAQNKTTDTQVNFYRNDGDKEFILAYPGTASLQDGVTDIDDTPVPYTGTGISCSGCTVHMGLLRAWNSISQASENLINMGLKDYPGYNVTVVGHSLGGGIVGLAYPGLKGAGYKIRQAYTFGQLRTGNPGYADYIDSLSGATDENIGTYMRVTHANDGVPQLPAQSKSYRHSRTEIWADNGASGTPPATTSNTYRCYGQEPTDCNDSQHGVGVNQAHVNYPGLNVTCGSVL